MDKEYERGAEKSRKYHYLIVSHTVLYKRCFTF